MAVGCPYAVLGLSRGASAVEIKAAYRALVVETHPDKHTTAPEPQQAAAAARFKVGARFAPGPARRMLAQAAPPLLNRPPPSWLPCHRAEHSRGLPAAFGRWVGAQRRVAPNRMVEGLVAMLWPAGNASCRNIRPAP
jgi:hypothetical protein